MTTFTLTASLKTNKRKQAINKKKQYQAIEWKPNKTNTPKHSPPAQREWHVLKSRCKLPLRTTKIYAHILGLSKHSLPGPCVIQSIRTRPKVKPEIDAHTHSESQHQPICENHFLDGKTNTNQYAQKSSSHYSSSNSHLDCTDQSATYIYIYIYIYSNPSTKQS